MNRLILFGTLFLSGCAGMNQVKVPANEVRFKTPYGELTLLHPQNTAMTNVDISFSTNGEVHAKIGSLMTVNSPDVIDKTAAGQAALIKANGEAMVNAIKAAADAAGTVAGAAAKSAVK